MENKSDLELNKKNGSSFEEKNPNDPLIEVIFVDCRCYFKNEEEKQELK